jgi:hypothetical protein
MTLDTNNNAPVILCPVNITTNVDASSCGAVVTFADATATDVDGDLDTVEQTDGLSSGSEFPVGISTIEYTATDLNGNETICTFTITVQDNIAPVVTCPTDITIDPGVGNLYEVPNFFTTGDASAEDNCTNPVTIISQNPAVGEMLEDGVYEVTLIAEDEYGNIGECTFSLTVETTLGIQGNTLENSIRIYPNPAKNEVTIAKNKAISLENVTIYDITGRLINTVDLKNMGEKQTIEISQLESGVYFLQINSEKANITKQLIKE